ncbi:MAG: polysaccharide deacetylase, partial [Clostridiales bacterium]|nr:polysaccharide deacetylase [Clostridiales bacterium]
CSSDLIDWRDKDAELIFKRATRNMKNGDFVLMHPTAHTLEALPEILKFYSDNGYSAATVSTSLG